MSPSQMTQRVGPQVNASAIRSVSKDDRLFGGRILPFALVAALAWCPYSLRAEDLRALVLEAAKATKEGLRSGTGEGTFRRWDGQGNLTYEIAFWVTMKGDKHRLVLEYRKKPRAHSIYNTRIVVSDGSGSFFSRDVGEGGKGDSAEVTKQYGMATRGISLDVAGRTRLAFPSAKHFERPVTLEKLPDGTVRGSFDVTARARASYECSPRVGYRVVRYESLRTSGKRTGVLYTSDWNEVDYVWYVQCFRHEDWVEGEVSERSEMRYGKFRPNVPVNDDMFTLAALGLKPGDRVFDFRPDAPSPLHEVTQPTDAAGKRLDSMAAQLKALPRNYPERAMTGRWWSRMLILGINAVAVAAVALIWILWRRHSRRKAAAAPG